MWRLFTLTLSLLVTAWTRESCFLPLAHKQLTALGFILSPWLLRRSSQPSAYQALDDIKHSPRQSQSPFLKKKKMKCHIDSFGFGCCPLREREDGEDGGQRECRRLCDYYITVITKRLKQQSSILWGLQGNWFCVQRGWDHILLNQSETQKGVWVTSKKVKLNYWPVYERQNKKGEIRKPPGWRCQIVNSQGKLQYAETW